MRAVDALHRARQPAKAPKPSANVRSVRYSSSPLLASKTPPWRSKFLVALVGLSFCVLLGRAAYIQIVGSAFFLKQGEIRYARTLDLPASRGRIVDRNGLILASSVPAPSIWAIPKDFEADKGQQAQATPLRVEKAARDKLAMRTATPAVTQYVAWDRAASAVEGRAP